MLVSHHNLDRIFGHVRPPLIVLPLRCGSGTTAAANTTLASESLILTHSRSYVLYLLTNTL